MTANSSRTAANSVDLPALGLETMGAIVGVEFPDGPAQLGDGSEESGTGGAG